MSIGGVKSLKSENHVVYTQDERIKMETKKTDFDERHIRHQEKEQQKLKAECQGIASVVRRCPYCGHKIEIVYKGYHGYSEKPCSNCGRIVCFAPLKFRMA